MSSSNDLPETRTDKKALKKNKLGLKQIKIINAKNESKMLLETQ